MKSPRQQEDRQEGQGQSFGAVQNLQSERKRPSKGNVKVGQ